MLDQPCEHRGRFRVAWEFHGHVAAHAAGRLLAPSSESSFARAVVFVPAPNFKLQLQPSHAACIPPDLNPLEFFLRSIPQSRPVPVNLLDRSSSLMTVIAGPSLATKYIPRLEWIAG